MLSKNTVGITVSFMISDDYTYEMPIHQIFISSENVDLIKRDYYRMKNFLSEYTDVLGKFFSDDYKTCQEWFHADDEFDKALEDMRK